jgi:hypothetical protein
MSQLTPETKEIDGHNYEMYMLDPMTSHHLLTDVVKMIGPSLGPVFDVFFSGAIKKDQSILDQEVNSDFFTKAAGSLFGALDKNTLDRVINAFQEKTHVDGKMLKGIFLAHFLGRLDSMYKWLIWGAQVQWGKSFNALVEALPIQKVLEADKALKSPTT